MARPDLRSFRAWAMRLFRTPRREVPWLDGPDIARELLTDDEIELAYLTHLFEGTLSAVRVFRSGMLCRGLDTLKDPGRSHIKFLLDRPQLEWASRQRCIHAQFVLYRDGFTRCQETAPKDLRGPSLELTSFMWWDSVLPYNYGGQQEWEAHLDVMEKILRLKHELCWYSALHGLGHVFPCVRGRAERIIDEFVDRRSDLSPALREYARQVRAFAVE